MKALKRFNPIVAIFGGLGMLGGLLLLGFAPFGGGDGVPDVFELQGEPGLQGAEAGQVRRQVVHVFDCRE